MQCIHCNMFIKKNDDNEIMCFRCVHDKNIMYKLSDLMKIYNIPYDKINMKLFYHTYINKTYYTPVMVCYIYQFHEMVQNFVENLPDTNNTKKNFIKHDKIINVIIENNNKNREIYKIVLKDVDDNLEKYNIQKSFCEIQYIKEQIVKKIHNLIDKCVHDINCFTIKILDYIKELYMRKNEIDEKINALFSDEFKPIAIKHPEYIKYIIYQEQNLQYVLDVFFENENYLIEMNKRNEEMKLIMIEINDEIDKYMPSNMKIDKYQKMIEQQKISYVKNNDCSRDKCKSIIKNIICDDIINREIDILYNKIKLKTTNRYRPDLIKKIYTNYEFIGDAIEQIKKKDVTILRRHERIIEKIDKLKKKYENINDLIYNFRNHSCILFFKICDKNFNTSNIYTLNNNINELMFDYVLYEKNEYKLTVKLIKEKFKMIDNIIKNYEASKELICFIKSKTPNIQTNVIRYGNELDRNLSFDDKMKKIKEYYLMNNIPVYYTDENLKKKFMETEEYEIFSNNNDIPITFCTNLFKIFLKKNHNNDAI